VALLIFSTWVDEAEMLAKRECGEEESEVFRDVKLRGEKKEEARNHQRLE
jgi:hypothetical protein